jgi:hypothetical protein
MSRVVPTPNGDVSVFLDRKTQRVSTTGTLGTVRFRSAAPPAANTGVPVPLGDGRYELRIDAAGEIYEIALG